MWNNSLWRVPLAAGAEDALNPCVLITCAFFILHGFWAKHNDVPLARARILFVTVYVGLVIVFNLGIGQEFIFSDEFMSVVQWLYVVAGLGALVLAAMFVRDWVLLHQGRSPRFNATHRIFTSPKVVVWLGTVILASVLAVGSMFWPMSYWMVAVMGTMLSPGQELMLFQLMALYALVVTWPLLVLWVCLSVRGIGLSLLTMICAAVFVAASSALILIFK